MFIIIIKNYLFDLASMEQRIHVMRLYKGVGVRSCLCCLFAGYKLGYL